MLEKALTIGLALFGAGLGVNFATTIATPTDPKVVNVGKEIASGVIFGTLGYTSAKTIYPMLPQKVKEVN